MRVLILRVLNYEETTGMYHKRGRKEEQQRNMLSASYEYVWTEHRAHSRVNHSAHAVLLEFLRASIHSTVRVLYEYFRAYIVYRSESAAQYKELISD
jgi:hypothetical protein